MKVDWLIVGAGFTGSVLAERIASQLDQKVLIVEQRRHIGGNAYDFYDSHGVLVHQYGPHIFHTNSRKVWEYLSQFTEWRTYYHRVLASVEGKLVPVPFNLNSLYALFPPGYARRLEDKLISTYGFGAKIPILKMRETSDADLRTLAAYIYDNIFYGYTLKQWELKPEELDASVTSRVPVHISRDDRYFQDAYQAIPKEGYTALFQRMLSHPNIKLLLGTSYQEIAGEVQFKRMIYSGAIDAFFEYIHGALPYRSLHFEFRYSEAEKIQEVGQVNYPNDQPFTRITEFKHITGQIHPGSTIALEYSQTHVPGKTIPYYPIPREENRAIYNKYREECKKLGKGVLFAGRLADYQYYNMDQAVARGLRLFEEEVTKQ